MAVQSRAAWLRPTATVSTPYQRIFQKRCPCNRTRWPYRRVVVPCRGSRDILVTWWEILGLEGAVLLCECEVSCGWGLVRPLWCVFEVHRKWLKMQCFCKCFRCVEWICFLLPVWRRHVTWHLWAWWSMLLERYILLRVSIQRSGGT